MYQALADELDAAPIQHIGKLLVLWRPKPANVRRREAEDRMPGPRDVKVHQVQQARRPAARSASTLRVLGNQRLTRPAGRSSAPSRPSRNRHQEGRNQA
jgi:RNA-binding protein